MTCENGLVLLNFFQMALKREQDFNSQLSGSIPEQDNSSNSWFKRRKKGISTSTADKKEVPDGLWTQCPSCKYTCTTVELKENLSKPIFPLQVQETDLDKIRFPKDWIKVAQSFSLKTYKIDTMTSLTDTLAKIYNETGPVFINVEINPEQKLYPVLKFGDALEKQMPPLDKINIDNEMLVAPFKKKI